MSAAVITWLVVAAVELLVIAPWLAREGPPPGWGRRGWLVVVYGGTLMTCLLTFGVIAGH